MERKYINILIFALVSVLGLYLVLYTIFAQENSGNQDYMYSTEGTGRNIDFSPRQSVCSSGFSKIPSDLHEVYLEQVVDSKNKTQHLKYELKNKIDFYGYLYPKTEKLGKNNTLECDSPPSSKEINFIPLEINNLLRMYMSAYIENKLTVLNLKKEMKEPFFINTKIEMCMSYECGTKELNGTIKSHNIKTLDQLESVDKYSFTHLYINVSNKIKSKTQNEEYGFYLSDDEISNLMIDAGKIAVSEVKIKSTEKPISCDFNRTACPKQD